MSKALIVAYAALFYLPQPARAQQAPGAPAKLTWTYPCAFAYSDGSPLANAPQPLECDFIHVRLQAAAEQFNALPTLDAQQRFLAAELSPAKAAIALYVQQRDGLLGRTEPSSLPARLTPQQRLADLMRFQTTLRQETTTYCEPFLWPVLEQPSYVLPTDTSWQRTWLPCMDPFWQRGRQLNVLIAQAQTLVIAAEGARIEGRIARYRPTRGKAPFDEAGPAPPPKEVAAPSPPPAAPAEAPEGVRPPTPPVPSPTMEIPSDPQAQIQRNYFARGFAAGMERLREDAAISWWHATGRTSTLGDPLGKTGIVFHQLGETCAIASQEEALADRGVAVPMPRLVSDSIAKGWYSEARLANGMLSGGTLDKDFGALLQQYGVPVTRSERIAALPSPPQGPQPAPPRVTQGQMVAALGRDLATSGDALVSVNTARLWQKPGVPAAAAHAVYVTGAEVDNRTGKIVGFYIDDTGTDEAARFVPRTVFLNAWAKRNDFLVSIGTPPPAPAPPPASSPAASAQ